MRWCRLQNASSVAPLSIRHGGLPPLWGIWQPGEKYRVWMSHGDKIVQVPPGFRAVASSDSSPFAVITHEIKPFYAQFHPEVVHTLEGAQLLKNFVHKIAGCAGDWTMANFREEVITKIRKQVGDGNVICGLSGGVDSSVAAVLIMKPSAISSPASSSTTACCVRARQSRWSRLSAIASISNSFTGTRAISSSASSKSRTIRKRSVRSSAGFYRSLRRRGRQIGGADFLAQGTLYPDVIESVSFTGGPSVTIKSHHNVGGLPERMNMSLVERPRTLQGRGPRPRA